MALSSLPRGSNIKLLPFVSSWTSLRNYLKAQNNDIIDWGQSLTIQLRKAKLLFYALLKSQEYTHTHLIFS